MKRLFKNLNDNLNLNPPETPRDKGLRFSALCRWCQETVISLYEPTVLTS